MWVNWAKKSDLNTYLETRFQTSGNVYILTGPGCMITCRWSLRIRTENTFQREGWELPRVKERCWRGRLTLIFFSPLFSVVWRLTDTRLPFANQTRFYLITLWPSWAWIRYRYLPLRRLSLCRYDLFLRALDVSSSLSSTSSSWSNCCWFPFLLHVQFSQQGTIFFGKTL